MALRCVVCECYYGENAKCDAHILLMQVCVCVSEENVVNCFIEDENYEI